MKDLHFPELIMKRWFAPTAESVRLLKALEFQKKNRKKSSASFITATWTKTTEPWGRTNCPADGSGRKFHENIDRWTRKTPKRSRNWRKSKIHAENSRRIFAVDIPFWRWGRTCLRWWIKIEIWYSMEQNAPWNRRHHQRTFSLPDLVQKISQIFLLNLWKSTNSDFGALNFSFPHQTVWCQL